MKRLLTLALVLCTSVANADTVLHNDGGGVMDLYIRAVSNASKSERIRIRGFCASACTFYLWRAFDLNVCAERGARLMFHMPYYARMSSRGPVRVETGRRAASLARQEWNDLYLGRFDRKLNRILSAATLQGRIPSPAAGDNNKKMFTVPAEQVLPRC